MAKLASRMKTKIRPATPNDAPGIVETVRAVYDEYGFTWEAEGYHADLHDPQTHYIDKGHLFWVCEIDKIVVGTSALELFPPILGLLGDKIWLDDNYRIGGCDCALQRLYVRLEFRRRGLGRELFLQTLNSARELGRHAMEIWSDKRFVDAHRLYEKFGASLVGDRICNDPDKAPEWGLILELSKAMGRA